MESFRINDSDGACAHASRFAASHGGAQECHVHVLPGPAQTFEEQLGAVEAMYARALSELQLDASSAVLRRVFLSDAANQQAAVRRSRLAGGDGADPAADPAADPVALSVIEQPPLPERKIALWAYHLGDRTPLCKQRLPHGIALRRGACTHLLNTNLGAGAADDGNVGAGAADDGNVGAGAADDGAAQDGVGAPRGGADTSFAQTHSAFDAYAGLLARHGASLRDNVVRTWLFVQDIDHNYSGMVAARREFFGHHGLTAATHFIASTGIEGRVADPRRTVSLDAYAVAGVNPAQVRHLKASSHLGPTSAYGVTFERGTRVEYGDRNHVFISGTASIDPTGQTLHVGDLRRQTERTLSNVAALLAEAGATAADVVQMLIYLRDPSDRVVVSEAIEHAFPNTPALVLRAPVCRPSWLVEVECIAITPSANARWQPL